jgi:peptidoglycan/LPS O-acetylase OafA/YrhL
VESVEAELARGVKLGYRPELDGLRAFAVLGVMAYHYWLNLAPGGFLGVDLFFVLSGFLITRLLLEEVQRSGRIKLGQFYSRRAARLLPALFLVCAFVAIDALTVKTLGTASESLRGVVAALLYVTNWVGVFSHTSLSLGHLWSLAVEEQFYLVWPVVMLLAIHHGGVQTLRRTSMVLFAVASIQMAVRSLAGVSGFPTLYFSTDAHPMVMLMAGCSLACVADTITSSQSRVMRFWTRVAAAPFVAVVAVLFLKAGALHGIWYYRGGFSFVAVGFALVINRALTSDWVTAPLRARPIVWVGRLSYGLYLYHIPIYLFVGYKLQGQRHSSEIAISLIITFAAAAASYYVVERPIRRAVANRTTRGRSTAVLATT